MLSVGFIAGMSFAVHRARKRGLDPAPVYFLSLLILASSLVGARLFHFMFHFPVYARSGEALARLLSPRKGGLMVMGGLSFALAASWLYLRWKRLDVWEFSDILSPSVPLGSFFTRVGCFLNGCCYGKPTDSWLGIIFPDEAPVYRSPFSGIEAGSPVWPTQLFESLAGLLMFGLLLFAERYPKRFKGMTTGLMIFLFGAWRCFIDEFRFHQPEMVILGGGFSKNQVISMVVMLSGVVLLIMRSKDSAAYARRTQ